MNNIRKDLKDATIYRRTDRELEKLCGNALAEIKRLDQLVKKLQRSVDNADQVYCLIESLRNRIDEGLAMYCD